MPRPSRAINSIRPLPSIFTAFPVHPGSASTTQSSGADSDSHLLPSVQDGIEVVPFERSLILSAPILSPQQDDKEVFVYPRSPICTEKPLPDLPETIWQKLTLKQRVLTLLFAQFALLLVAAIALLTAKSGSARGTHGRVRAAGENTTSGRIQAGRFRIPIRLPVLQSSTCLARMNESVAWQCASDTTFDIDIISSRSDSSSTSVRIYSPFTNTTLYHGHQIPNTTLRYHSISDSIYLFRTAYDKVVLLREDDLTPAERPRSQPIMRHPIFRPDDKLWRCTFSKTGIEIHLHMNQTSSPEVASNRSSDAAELLPKVPYVMKIIEERTTSATEVPYCEEVNVKQDGLLSSPDDKKFLSPTNRIGSATNPKAARLELNRVQTKQQGQDANACRCQWLIQ